MRIGSGVKKLTSAAFAGALLFSQTALLPEFTLEADAASLCTVNVGKTYQTIQGFGGMNHPEWIGDLTASQRQTAFGNGDNELGLSILRVFVNPSSSQWSRAVDTAKFAQSKGATVFASPWEPPSNLAQSGSGIAGGGKLHLPSWNYGAYAKHLNDFGNFMKQNGVNLYSVSVQNEPDFAKDWTVWTSDETTSFIANYGDQITSTRLMSPESFQYAPENASWVVDGGKKFYKKILNNSKAFANTDLFGTHFYGTQRDWMDYPALESCGKPIWMTEVYTDSDHDADLWPMALDVSTNIHNALVVGNMSAYVWWYIRRSYGFIKDNGNITKRGYCMAQYSKFIRPGDVRVDVTEQPESGVYVSAYKNNKNQVTIVAVNTGTNGYSQQFSLGGKGISDVDRWRTSEGENLAKTNNLTIDNGSSFWAQLPAKSVSTFVVTLNGGVVNPDPNPQDDETTLDSNGYYFHDTFEDDLGKWQAHGGTELLKSGRNPYQGKEAMVVTNRTKAWMGAERTLSSAFKPGTAYSFSVNVCEMDGAETDTYYLKLNYTDASGQAHYPTIAEGVAPNGKYVQLSNTNYTIPSDAVDPVIYVETKDSTTNFYIDEAIAAPAGKTLPGAGKPEITTTNPDPDPDPDPQPQNTSYPVITSVEYNVTYHQFKLYWSAVQNAQAYGIAYYSAGKWRVHTQDISANTTSWTSPKLTPNKSYQVAVAAKVNGKWDTSKIKKSSVNVTVK